MIYSADGHILPSIAGRSADGRNPPKANTWSRTADSSRRGSSQQNSAIIKFDGRLSVALNLDIDRRAYFLLDELIGEARRNGAPQPADRDVTAMQLGAKLVNAGLAAASRLWGTRRT